MSRRELRVVPDFALVALILATALVVIADLQPVRPFVVILAACLVPGGAMLTRLRTGEGLSDLALAVGLSIAVEIIGALLLAWSGWWHPEVLGGVLGAASMGLLVTDLAKASR